MFWVEKSAKTGVFFRSISEVRPWPSSCQNIKQWMIPEVISGKYSGHIITICDTSLTYQRVFYIPQFLKNHVFWQKCPSEKFVGWSFFFRRNNKYIYKTTRIYITRNPQATYRWILLFSTIFWYCFITSFLFRVSK